MILNGELVLLRLQLLLKRFLNCAEVYLIQICDASQRNVIADDIEGVFLVSRTGQADDLSEKLHYEFEVADDGGDEDSLKFVRVKSDVIYSLQ